MSSRCRFLLVYVLKARRIAQILVSWKVTAQNWDRGHILVHGVGYYLTSPSQLRMDLHPHPLPRPHHRLRLPASILHELRSQPDQNRSHPRLRRPLPPPARNPRSALPPVSHAPHPPQPANQSSPIIHLQPWY